MCKKRFKAKKKSYRSQIHSMSSFGKWRNFKIRKTLVLSSRDYNIIKKGLQSKSKVDHEGLWANFSHRLMNIYQDRERKQHASLDHSETFGRSWKSLWKLWTPLNHCVVCLGMPMFTERSLMKNLWLHEEHPHTRSVDVLPSYTISATSYHQANGQK